MSSIIKGSRYTPATFRCPTNLLYSAVHWEQLRAAYFQARGENRRSTKRTATPWFVPTKTGSVTRLSCSPKAT